MAELTRTRQGQFCLNTPNCLEYDDVLQGETVWGPKVERMLRQWMDPDSTDENGSAREVTAAAPSPAPPVDGLSPPRDGVQCREAAVDGAGGGTMGPPDELPGQADGDGLANGATDDTSADHPNGSADTPEIRIQTIEQSPEPRLPTRKRSRQDDEESEWNGVSDTSRPQTPARESSVAA